MMSKWLREPLLHFLLIGVVLFVLYGLKNDDVDDARNRIVITEADVDRLITLWEKQRQRLPTMQELQGLIESQVREEVLYREALSMGLDQDDVVVRRRMAQKVEFIFSDIASLAEPTDQDLAAYLQANADAFEIPGRISFRQVYLDPGKHGDALGTAVAGLLAQLEGLPPDADIDALGDMLMLAPEHENQTPHDVMRLFGSEFSQRVFELSQGAWAGPVRSGYGIHLVQVLDRTEPAKPELDAVRDKLRNEWFAWQRRKGDEMFYQSLRERYEVIIESGDPAVAAASSMVSGSGR